jgi:hypothetical protein
MASAYDTQPYIESITAYREALVKALEVCDDPFKAPELSIGTARAVVAAAWEMQVEYAAITRKR